MEAFGNKLLPSSCLPVHFSYMIASARRGDSRAINVAGGPMGILGLLMSGGLNKIAHQADLDR